MHTVPFRHTLWQLLGTIGGGAFGSAPFERSIFTSSLSPLDTAVINNYENTTVEIETNIRNSTYYGIKQILGNYQLGDSRDYRAGHRSLRLHKSFEFPEAYT